MENYIIKQIHNMLLNAYSKDLTLSLDLGESVIKLWQLMSNKQKATLRGKFRFEDSYEKQVIEITENNIDMTFIDFDSELIVPESCHECFNECSYYKFDKCLLESLDLNTELPKEKRLAIIDKITKKPYMLQYCDLGILTQYCYVNIPHNHYYVGFYETIQKNMFNSTMYEDFTKAMRATTRAYYDMLYKAKYSNL